MKKWTLSEKVVAQFKMTKVISWANMNEICWFGWRKTCWIIRSLIKIWYDIKITKSDDLLYIKDYTLIKYTKPFYLIARDIKDNHPRLEGLVRFYYNIVKKWQKNI